MRDKRTIGAPPVDIHFIIGSPDGAVKRPLCAEKVGKTVPSVPVGFIGKGFQGMNKREAPGTKSFAGNRSVQIRSLPKKLK